MELNRIHNCTAIDLFNSLQEKAALIVADPPYGIGYHSGYKTALPSTKKAMAHRGADRKKAPVRKSHRRFNDDVIDTSWLLPAFEALQDGGAMYLFTRWDVLHHWQAAAAVAGFNVAQCIIWNKAHFGMGNLDYYGSQTEFILFCVKGKHVLRWDKREGNVWYVPTIDTLADGGGKHPTQKPTRLMRKIITYSSDANDLIVDPFTGSGSACIAAQRLHRRFIGCDISPTFASAAQEWVEQTVPHTLPMF